MREIVSQSDLGICLSGGFSSCSSYATEAKDGGEQSMDVKGADASRVTLADRAAPNKRRMTLYTTYGCVSTGYP